MSKKMPGSYQISQRKFSGTSYGEIEKQARNLHKHIAAQTKRHPYVRSAYFNGEKIFIDGFWDHLHQKPRHDRKRRLQYYACALELIRKSRSEPLTKLNPNKPSEILHRFSGVTAEGYIFYVQIRQEKRTGNKYFMSVFQPN